MCRSSLVKIEVESNLRLVRLHFLLVISVHWSLGLLLAQTQGGGHRGLPQGSLPSLLLLRPVVRLQGEAKHLRLVHLGLLFAVVRTRNISLGVVQRHANKELSEANWTAGHIMWHG